jgi:hypothetical protein
MQEAMVTPSGERHGLINRVANSVPDNGFAHFKGEWKKKAEDLRKKESKIVKARYINHRGEHERLTKPYCRWAGDPIDTWHLIPGFEYELPLGFVEEVNDKNKILPKRSEILDSSGRPTLKDGPGERLHELVPVGF